MKLTQFELAVLTAIDKSEYGEYVADEIWMFSVENNMPVNGPNGKQISGTIASLTKKGLVYSNPTSTSAYATIGMTDAGVKLYVETVKAAGGKVRKLLVD